MAERRPGNGPCRSGSVTVIVPTYRERENLPELLRRVGAARDQHGLRLDLLVLDDDSRDGTAEYFRSEAPPWARLITRTTNRGLSAAVLDGLRAAAGDTLLVMDADLSHPPEKLPELLDALDAEAEFVIGSRYIPGGATTADWHMLRRVNSLAATLLARPFTNARDPMAGFFALRRRTFEGAAPLDPVGYKIGLELLVKCGVTRVSEVPILFTERQLGKSKLTVAEQLRYLEHIRRLAVYRFGVSAALAFFVGASLTSAACAVLVLWVLLIAGAGQDLALVAASCIAAGAAWLLNFTVTFRHAMGPARSGRFVAFSGAAVIAGAAQVWTSVQSARWLAPGWAGALSPFAAVILGAIAGGAAGLLLCLPLLRPAPAAEPITAGGGA